MGDEAIRAALDRAADDASREPPLPGPDGVRRSRHLAVGDPQAPLATLLEILHRRDLLDPQTGRLRGDAALTTLGDYFDWGRREDRSASARDSVATLAWLAAHPPDQVQIVVGNHDLARVCELAAFDDDTFTRARDEADAAYHDKRPHRDEASFRRQWRLPSWEIAARDFSTFRTEQRQLVRVLLRAGRFRLAIAVGPHKLLCHAGVTHRQLDELGVERSRRSDAHHVAGALERRFQTAARAYEGGRFELPGLHSAGDAEAEGDGMLYHRAAQVAGPRRFLPADLPAGLTQGVGHVRDAKSRQMLGYAPDTAVDGPLRTLRVHAGGALEYQHGVVPGGPDHATMVFLDGAMLHAPPGAYEMLDVGAWRSA